MTVTVGLVDGGLPPDAALPVLAHASFCSGGPSKGGLAHAGAMAQLIAARAPQARLLDARTFGIRGPATAAEVAAALDWCTARGARIINLSLGLREDRPLLRSACQRALAAGAVLVASTPPRGEAVFPAAYEGVIAVCGDARCESGDHSLLESPRLFAASPAAPDGRGGGASFAAARICGAIAAWFGRHPDADASAALDGLARGARWVGRERHLEIYP